MNSNLTKWVTASIIKHFKDGLNDYLWVTGEKLETKKSQRFELRYIGPTYIIGMSEVTCRVGLNLTVRSSTDPQNPFNHFERVGLAQSVFTNCIRIFKYGSVSGVDTQEQFDYMRLNSEINTVNYGQIDLVDNVVISTIEADYIGEFRT